MDLSFIIENTVGNLYWKDRAGKYLGCNKSFSDLIGLTSPDEIIGKDDRDLFLKTMGEEKISVLMNGDQDIMQSGIGKTFTEEGVDAQGQAAFYTTKKIPLFDQNKQVIGLMGTSIDITKEKQAELAKTQFIKNIEHDLRTPFSGIVGVAEWVYDEAVDPELKEKLGWILTSAKSWTTIISELVDVFSDTYDQVVIEAFDLKPMLHEITNLFLAKIKTKNIAFYCDCVPCQIKTDKKRLHRILLNLVSNAVKFTEQGAITLTVSPTVSGLEIIVQDTGIGIPPDKMDFIFERFTKLSPSNIYGNEFKGWGLGLFIAKQFIADIGGQISVESKPNKGSKFILTLKQNKN